MSERDSYTLLLTFARQGEEPSICKAMEFLRRESPAVRFVALGSPVSAAMLRGVGIEHVNIFGEGSSVRSVLRQIKDLRPSSTAIIYCGPGARGHLKLEALALAVGSRRICRFISGEPTRSVSRSSLLLSVAAKSLLALGCLAVSAVVCALAFCSLLLAQVLSGGRGARWA